MFCYQCEQAAKGKGCDQYGVCGKDPEVAALQDALVHQVMQIARVGHRLNLLGLTDEEGSLFVLQGLFTTVTNVDFDPARKSRLLRCRCGTLSASDDDRQMVALGIQAHPTPLT